jgi:hypothetical protein
VPNDSWVDLDGGRPRGDVYREAPRRGVRTVTGLLPNGRVVWLRIDPPLAPAVAVDHLAQLVEHKARWRRAATLTQSESVTRLSRTVAADAERMSDGHLGRAKALRRQIVAGDHRIDRKLAKAAEEYRSRIEQQLRIELDSIRRLGRRDLWDQLVVVSAFPLFAAYGQPGRPFGANNVALALSLLIWLVGDEIVDFLFGSEQASPYPLRDTDAWSYVAPVGNLLAGWWLLDDRQHQRFVVGRVVIPRDSFKTSPTGAAAVMAPELVYQYETRIGLSRLVAPEHFPDFQRFTNVPAVATITSIRRTAAGAAARIGPPRAKVLNGELTIRLEAAAPHAPGGPIPPILDELEIVWIVDTQEPATTPPN